MSGAAIAARGSGLVKRFDETTALGGVSFSVAAGDLRSWARTGREVHAVPILATLIIPSEGRPRSWGGTW